MRKDRFSTTIDLILLLLFTISSIFLCIQLYLGKSVSFAWLILIALCQVGMAVGFFAWVLVKKKPALRKVLLTCFSIITCLLLLFFNDKNISNRENDKIYTYYQMNLVMESKWIDQEIKDQKLGVLVNDRNHIQGISDINKTFGIKDCEMKEYSNIKNLLKAMKEEKISGMIVSDQSYEQIQHLSDNYVKISSGFHKVEISHHAQSKSLNQPFSVLFLVSDNEVNPEIVTQTDTCVLMFVDPVVSKISMIQLPIDLYMPNVAYDSYPDRLYHLSYNGIDNVLYSFNSVFDFNIDYFIKMNLDTLKSLVDVMQGIRLPECEQDLCHISSKISMSEEVLAGYLDNHDLNAVLKGIFEKRKEMTGAKLANFINVLSQSSFTNFNLTNLRMFILNDLSQNSYGIDTYQVDDLKTSLEPCVSLEYGEKEMVAIMSPEFIQSIYQYQVNMQHLEIMKQFSFDLNKMVHQKFYPTYNEKVITTENMNWRIDSFFALLPESSVNPIEVEKWQGKVTFDKPNFDPNQSIQPID